MQNYCTRNKRHSSNTKTTTDGDRLVGEGHLGGYMENIRQTSFKCLNQGISIITAITRNSTLTLDNLPLAKQRATRRINCIRSELPSRLKMRVNSSSTVDPGNKGQPVAIS